MAYDLKYDKLLRAIERGKQTEAVSLFERGHYDVNEAIHYLFEDGKRFTVTPLYWAVRHNCPRVCKYLLAKGARPYGALVYEYYPLHEACNRGYDGVVQEFVNARCEVDRVNRDADTPLHVACMRGHIQSVHILLRAGSDCNLRNKLGHTPLQCAVYHDRNDLVDLFKAHNKGIETTPPLRNATGSTVGRTLTATGVKVQRSQSFNAADTTISGAGVNEVRSRKKEGSGGHGGRIRNSSSSSRPLSYYENGGNGTALVIGQQPLSTFTQSHSQSMQSLSGSSYLSSFPTVSTHLPINYSIPSPDSPVELDAPKKFLSDPSQTIGPVTVTTSSKKLTAPPASTCLHSYSIPTEDFGTKHGNRTQNGGGGGGPGNISEEGGTLSTGETFATPCPFPSPGGGGIQKESPEKKSAPQQPKQHPLSSSTRSEHQHQQQQQHHHVEKPLHERMSHPEFHITRRSVQIANRAKSTNDVSVSFGSGGGGGVSSGSSGSATGREFGDSCSPHVSPTREHINALTSSLCDTLELATSSSTTSLPASSSLLPHPPSSLAATPSPSSSSSSSRLHPLLQSLKTSLGTQAHRFGLSPDHVKCLSELSLSPSSLPHPPSSLPSSHMSSLSSSSSSSSPCVQEVDFDVVEGPIEVKISREEDGGREEAFMTLVYKVQVCDALVQLRSQMNHQGDIALLKVRVRLDPDLGVSPSVGHLNDAIPEAALLQALPSHPNVVSVLYSCRGQTEKFRDHFPRSEFNTTTAGSPSGSRSGTTECPHGSENGPQTTYTPASTGSLLFQSAPGVSLGKYFRDFLQSRPKDSTIEDKFLHILAQLLLAVAHLRQNLVSHCAIDSHSVYVSERGQRVMLGEFGHAVNMRPKNLDGLQRSLRRLKASGKSRRLSPEAEKRLASIDTEDSSTNFQTALPDIEESFSLSDSYAVGALFYDLLGAGGRGGGQNVSESTTETPFIHCLSFRCNYLLQKLVAQDPSDRFSALQGAMSCFVLLFGPRASEIFSLSECIRWLVSESLELYLNPVLRDSAPPGTRDGGGNYARRLHYAYLISANPELVYNSCKCLNSD